MKKPSLLFLPDELAHTNQPTMLHRYNNPYVEEKVYLERILRADEVEAFSQTLRPHQLAIGGDGLTVLKRAVRSRRLHRLMTLFRGIRGFSGTLCSVGRGELGVIVYLHIPQCTGTT